MVKRLKKPPKTKPNPINRVLVDNKSSPKSKKEINSSYYQKNKEKLRFQRRDNYQQDKETEKEKRRVRYQHQKKEKELTIKQTQAKYYQAKHIEILMPFSEYTELTKETKKLWKDFNWTLQVINESITGIVDIMKLEQVAGRLVRHYLETAKSKEKKERASWNLLDYDEQMKLVKYWGREKARIENGYIDEAERLERQSQSYLKEIERAKFHEERGKIKCPCYQCQESKKIQSEIKEQLFKKEQEGKPVMIEGECSNCYQYKKIDPESGLCRKCADF